MYGHGPKPHRCLYTDCERSQETNGFPRKWNLYDHMKRVHSYTGPEPSDRSDSPSPSDSSHDHETTADPVPTQRKRRSPKPADQGPPKRVRRAATRANARTTNSKNGSDVPLEEPQMERMPQQRHMPLLEQLFDEHSDRMQTPMMNQEYEILAPEALEQWPVDLAVYHELFNGINGQTLS